MKIDIHTHVLPGIDDGAKDWETCIEMLAQSAASGVEKIIATPHYLPWGKNASPKRIRMLCQEASEKLYKERGIALDIYPGNEIYYSIGVAQKVKNEEVLTLAGTRYVLVEFQTAGPYQELCRAVREFRDGGFIPIVAHMERYQCLERMERIEELKELGALMQMNADSIDGGFWQKDSRKAKQLLAKGVIDFMASDMHGLGRRSPITDGKLQWVYKKLDSEYQQELIYGNAEKMLSGIKA